jgi:hypothetical protein
MTDEYRNKRASAHANKTEKYNRYREESTDDDEVIREYYTSNDKVVRNGVYGTVYPFDNGTWETSQLFRVIDATGRCDSSGIRLKNKKVNRSSNLVYYNSPAEYTEHRKIKLDPKVVEEWSTRLREIMEKHEENMEKNQEHIDVN